MGGHRIEAGIVVDPKPKKNEDALLSTHELVAPRADEAIDEGLDSMEPEIATEAIASTEISTRSVPIAAAENEGDSHANTTTVDGERGTV